MFFISTNIHKKINKSNYDLINLHWVQGEFISIESIGKITKPIVWTLHDTWAFSGVSIIQLISMIKDIWKFTLLEIDLKIIKV